MSYRTFAPDPGPSFAVPLDWEWLVDEQENVKPYVQVIPKLYLPRRRYALGWKVGTRALRDYLVSFFHRQIGPTTPFWWAPPDPVTSPEDEGPDLDEIAGGALSQRTYYVRFTWYDSTTATETTASPAATITVQANYLLTVTAPRYPSQVASWRVYASETSGEECLQGTATDRTWTEQTGGLATGTAAPPTTNTMRIPALWALQGGIKQRMVGANRYAMDLTLLERFG